MPDLGGFIQASILRQSKALTTSNPDPSNPRKKKPRSQKRNAVTSEGDGARTRNHRIDSPAKNAGFPEKNSASDPCFASALPTTDPTTMEFARIFPKLTPKQRRQLLALAKAMVE
jgi:hypothetical protein